MLRDDHAGAGIGIALERLGILPLRKETCAFGGPATASSERGSGTRIGGQGAALFCASPAQAQDRAGQDGGIIAQGQGQGFARLSEAARRSNIFGTVRLAVVIAPNGSVKSAKPFGGHPLLVEAAMDAMKQWKFEAGPNETGGVVEFKFKP